MARGIVFKFLAILLCSALLLTALASGTAVVGLAAGGLYSRSVEDLYSQQLSGRLSFLADRIVTRYLAEEKGGCPQRYLDSEYNLHISYPFDLFAYDKWFYVITDRDGRQVDYKTGNFLASQAYVYEETVLTEYPTVIDMSIIDPDTEKAIPEETFPQGTLVPGTTSPTMPLDYCWNEGLTYTDSDGTRHEYMLGWTMPDDAYTVTVFLLPGGYLQENAWEWELLEQLWTYRFELIGICAAALLGFIILLVYLCCVAAKKWRSEEIRPAGLNRLPLDLYAGITATGVILAVAASYELIGWHMDAFDPWWLLWLLVGAMGYAAGLLITAFLFACAAQGKVGDGFWYKHSVLGWSIRILLLAKKLVGFLKRSLRPVRKLPFVFRKLWGAVAALCAAVFTAAGKLVAGLLTWLRRLFSWLWRSLSRCVALLPLTWQWLLTAFLLIFIMVLIANSRSTGAIMVGLLAVMALVLYGTHCFGTLLESTARMSKGDLDIKVEDKLLIGSFKDFATHLNALADVAMEAAKKQMRSERMKAELVTNVSHDIKTPLTSIINYVDLLQKAETEGEREEYLEVLDRQSQRLKKLIEDLMEMSKASTGNITVSLEAVDPVEAVNQALGEFADKLEAANLVPIFQAPEAPLRMIADGRLAWRVLSNLLSNAVKYALPGTRLYIDITRCSGKVLISLKNISREQLNVSSDELMERFVRGDASRNTEGSGLGLNIAKNLMELQKGHLQLLVDGDLFKATLLFPEA